jgi:hypothetical protein
VTLDGADGRARYAAERLERQEASRIRAIDEAPTHTHPALALMALSRRVARELPCIMRSLASIVGEAAMCRGQRESDAHSQDQARASMLRFGPLLCRTVCSFVVISGEVRELTDDEDPRGSINC